MPLADDVLADLLQRGERARMRGSERAIQTAFTKLDSPYWQQEYAQQQHAFTRLIAAERADAVRLRWASQGGDDRHLEQVRLLDVDRLAAFLGVASRSGAMQLARTTLQAWLATHPRVTELLEAWERLKSPRGLGTESAADFVDALRVLDALQAGQDDDQIVRAFSHQLFRDSKRIEALARHIDLLTAEQLGAPARQQEEVFGALGLVKEPQPFLVAGTGRLILEASQDCPVAKPFVGVSNRHIVGYAGTPAWMRPRVRKTRSSVPRRAAPASPVRPAGSANGLCHPQSRLMPRRCPETATRRRQSIRASAAQMSLQVPRGTDRGRGCERRWASMDTPRTRTVHFSGLPASPSATASIAARTRRSGTRVR